MTQEVKKTPEEINETLEENSSFNQEETSSYQELLQEAQNAADSNDQADRANLFEQLRNLELQLKEKEEIARNSQIAYLHLKSDFDILQRQTDQKIENANRDALIMIAKKLLPQIENLRKSLLNLTPEQQESSMGKGLLMMQEGFLKTLASLHIQPIESLGLEPNPQFHEPVSMQATQDSALKGKIIQEFEQGFYYKKGEELIVLNPAKVVVGN